MKGSWGGGVQKVFIINIAFYILSYAFQCLPIILLFLLISGSFAEEDIGRQGIGAASVMGNAAASRGLEVAVANLQDYCNGKFYTIVDIFVYY